MGRKNSSIDISNLSVGQEFKNLQEMSLLVLGERLPPGKGRTNRLSLMQQYFSWEKVKNSHKVVITEIYPIRKRPFGRCKYAPLIFNILASYPGELCFTKNDLLHVLGIVNNNFDSKKFTSNANRVDLPYKVFKNINSEIFHLLSSVVIRNLKLLESYGYIKLEQVRNVLYKDPSIKEVSSSTIDNLYQECLSSFDCKNFYEIVSKGVLKEFNALCSDKFSSLGIQRVFNTYKISILAKPSGLPDKEKLNIICRETLVNHYKSNSAAMKVIDLYMSS